MLFGLVVTVFCLGDVWGILKEGKYFKYSAFNVPLNRTNLPSIIR